MKMNDFFVEIACSQINKNGQIVSGDVFQSKQLKDENRYVTVLSDGLGSGIKANILATLTATMGLNFTSERFPLIKTAQTILDTLPVDSERKISYATFSIVDIDCDGETHLVEFDNPPALLLRNGQLMELPREKHIFHKNKKAPKELYSLTFMPQKEDRIVIFTDGVSQSGIGTAIYPFGWDKDEIVTFCFSLTEGHPHISAHTFADKITKQAFKNDIYSAKDDISCLVIYFRQPRKLLVCTGPPYDIKNDDWLTDKVTHFEGQKLICGGTTATIIARKMNKSIQVNMDNDYPELPPASAIEGIDLVTEGVLTLSKVSELLENYPDKNADAFGPAGKIIHMLRTNDEINFIVGTRINEAHQDPTLPVELEIRRNVVKKIVKILEDKFLKKVSIHYL